MSYGTVAGVEALIPVAGSFGVATTPTTTQVTSWLAQGYSIINRTLSAAGYAVPVESSADVYAELTGLEQLYAAANVIRARGLDTVQGTSEDRSVIWLEEFRSQLTDLVQSELSSVGVGRVDAATTSTAGRLRSTQMRKIDGYSATYEGDYSNDYDYPSE